VDLAGLFDVAAEIGIGRANQLFRSEILADGGTLASLGEGE